MSDKKTSTVTIAFQALITADLERTSDGMAIHLDAVRYSSTGFVSDFMDPKMTDETREKVREAVTKLAMKYLTDEWSGEHKKEAPPPINQGVANA